MKKVLISLLLAVYVLLCGCQKQEHVAFQVGNLTVTYELLETWYKDKAPSGYQLDEERKDALKTELVELIRRASYAEDQGVLDSPEYLLASWRIAAKHGDMVDQQNIEEPSEAELREIFQTTPEFQTAPEKRRFALLYVPSREKKGVSLKEAQTFYQKQKPFFQKNLERGFGALAVDYSFHKSTRYKGGVIPTSYRLSDQGMVSESWLAKGIETAYSLTKGECSSVIETESGAELLVLLMDIEPGKECVYQDVTPQLKKLYKQEKRRITAQKRKEILTQAYPLH